MKNNKKLAQYITNLKPVLLVEYCIQTKSTTKPALSVEHPTRSNQTTATERRVLIKLKNTVETDGKGKEGAHDPTQRTSTSPGPCGAISRLGRTGVAGPAMETVGRAAVVATLASSSRGWSCGPFPGLLRCPCPSRRRCPRRRHRPPRPPSLPAPAAPASASAVVARVGGADLRVRHRCPRRRRRRLSSRAGPQ
jgi:hypothetical protein